jgi:hypothetical protein
METRSRWGKLRSFITNNINNLFDSFNNLKKGWSGRKLSAFAGMIIAAYVTVKIVPPSEALHALYSWQIFILTCLGIVTVEQIIILFFDKKINKNDEQVKTESTV